MMTKSHFSKKDDPSWVTNIKIWQEYKDFCVAALVAIEDIEQDMAVAILLAGDGIDCVASHLDVSEERVRKVVDAMLDPTWSELYEKLIFPLERTSRPEEDSKPRSPDFLYLMRDPFTGYHKIGRSTDPERRVKELNRNIPPGGTTLDLIHRIMVIDSVRAERDLHHMFSEQRIQQEWFDLSEQDIDQICDMDGYRDGVFHFTFDLGDDYD